MDKKWIILIIISISAAVITISILRAYWYMGFDTRPVRYEKLEYRYYSVNLTSNREFIIRLGLRNTGSAMLTTDMIFLNGIPWNEQSGAVYQDVTGITLNPGESYDAIVILNGGYTWASGTSVEIMVHTAAGKDYPKTITLPIAFGPSRSFEHFEFTSVYQYLTTFGEFAVVLNMTNSGVGVSVTINQIRVMGRVDWSKQGDILYENMTGITLAPGQSANGMLILRRGYTWTDGMVVDIIIRTTSGCEYSKAVTLL